MKRKNKSSQTYKDKPSPASNVELFTERNIDNEITELRKKIKTQTHFLNSYTTNTRLQEEQDVLPKEKFFRTQNARRASDRISKDEFDANGCTVGVKQSKLFSDNKRFSFNKKEIDEVYKKVFDKNTRKLIEAERQLTPSLDEYAGKFHPAFVKNKINDIKSKIVFIKGVYDYAYPHIMIKKLKSQKIQNDIKIEVYQKKFITRQATMLQTFKIEYKNKQHNGMIKPSQLFTEKQDKPIQVPRINPIAYIRPSPYKTSKYFNIKKNIE